MGTLTEEERQSGAACQFLSLATQSLDGTRMAGISHDLGLRLLGDDQRYRSHVRALGHQALVFSPDHRELLTLGHEAEVRRFETDTGNELGFTYFPTVRGQALRISPNGKWLVASIHQPNPSVLSVTPTRTRVWNLETGQEATGLPSSLLRVWFTNDEDYLALDTDGKLTRGSLATTRREAPTAVTFPELPTKLESLLELAPSRDGRTLAFEHEQKVWVYTLGQPHARQLAEVSEYTQVALTDDASKLVLHEYLRTTLQSSAIAFACWTSARARSASIDRT